MGALAVRAVTKAFGSQRVLNGVDLELEAGTFTSILGPSGSGKTTLLRVIAGFERVDGGTVTIAGETVDGAGGYVPPNRRRIGYVPQEGSLFPHLTVEANIGFGQRRSNDRTALVRQYLEMVDLAPFAKRYPHELSGGQQQRVALARALAIEPSLVLMDEPFSALDATLRGSVRSDVRRLLRDAGATVLLVTHDQDEALSLADRVAVIRDGAIGQFVTPERLYRRPETPELARSLGEVNFLTGTAKGAWVDTPLGSLHLTGERFADGTDLLILVRPEQLVTGPSESDGPAAVVVDREFYGHDVILRLAPSWHPSVTLTSRLSDPGSAAPIGARVTLSVVGDVIAWRNE